MHLGFDIGGTKILGVAIDADPARPRCSLERPTVADADVITTRLLEMVSEMAAHTGAGVESLGVGIAGIVDRDGTLWYSPNIPGVVDFHLRDRLEAATDARIAVENDAAAATWAEARIGAGRGCENLALVALGTGIGTGFVLDGRLHHGWRGFSGESGHMIVEMTGEKHVTGARGPWELYASGSKLGAMVRAEVGEGRLPSLRAAGVAAEDLRGEHLELALAADDPDAFAVLDEYSRLVAIGLANLVHILDLELIIIGGGVVDLGVPLVEGVQRWTDEYILGGGHRPRPRVVAAELGPAAGALGAAMLARDRPDRVA